MRRENGQERRLYCDGHLVRHRFVEAPRFAELSGATRSSNNVERRQAVCCSSKICQSFADRTTESGGRAYERGLLGVRDEQADSGWNGWVLAEQVLGGNPAPGRATTTRSP